MSQAWTIGREYAIRGQRARLNRLEAPRAYLFFRNALLQALLLHFKELRLFDASTWSQVLGKAYRFTDNVIIALLEGYEKDGG